MKVADLFGRNLIIEDSKELFRLPEIIDENRDMLIEAHETSNIYNQLNVRVKNWFLTD